VPDKPIIVWLRHDLRLADNRSLAAAVASGAPVLPVFVLDDISPEPWAMGAASRWWLHGSLASLAQSLAKVGARLVLRRGRADTVLAKLTSDVDAAAVHCSRAYEPWAQRLEKTLHDRLDAVGIPLKRFAGALLHEPDRMLTKSGEPYKVFTPFWRALASGVEPPQPLPAPTRITPPDVEITSDDLAAWQLLPSKPDWAGGLRAAWQPGESAAMRRLADFLDARLAGYAESRDRPDREGTSRLSPHLHFGEVSPAQCWHAARFAAEQSPGRTGIETFLRELAWREFSHHLLFHFPSLPDAPYRPEFAHFPWRDDATALVQWQRGRTGYPIVDAGMRELWQTGWMHNRVRMIVASFLIKDLRLPWQAGEAWFWDTLVDADLANNAASWQWVAGSGADAAPYFRIFNPMTQGEKFDPDGAYVRRFIPELAALPASVIHAPWTASACERARAGVRLGETYPNPIVDHAAARAAALEGFATVQARRQEVADATAGAPPAATKHPRAR